MAPEFGQLFDHLPLIPEAVLRKYHVVAALVPGFDGTVKQVLFEHAPSRSNPAFTDDRTAFDALIRYTTAAADAASSLSR